MNNEAMKPERRNGVVQYWSDVWVSWAARCGWVVGKWTGFSHLEIAFSHLFPHNSTQVVDFPHLAMVSIFWESENLPQRRRGGGADFRGKKCGSLRVVTRKCAKVRTNQARKSSMLRIVTGETNFFRRPTTYESPTKQEFEDTKKGGNGRGPAACRYASSYELPERGQTVQVNAPKCG